MCQQQENAGALVATYLNEFWKEQGAPPKGRLIFRGQANKIWNVASSAGRRLEKEGKQKQNDYIRYHVNLIANARKNGYNKLEAGTKLSDLEVLAEIQHYGGATCLTDFTTNFLIALWFACEKTSFTMKDKKGEWVTVKDKYADGKVVWLDLGKEENFNNISYYNKIKEGDSIQHLLTKPAQNLDIKKVLLPRFWLWEPTKLNNRIIKQDSVFLFSLSAFPKKSSIEKERISFNQIFISERHKEAIRKELDTIFGINSETVFYDLTGYSNNANAVEIPVSEKILSNRHCLDNAKECFKKEQYSIASSYLDDALACKRGIVKCKKTDKSQCYNDCIGELLYWKGEALEGKGEIDDALLCYYEAANDLELYIKKDGKYKSDKFKLLCESYRKQSILYYQRQDYKDAIKADKKLYDLYKKNPNKINDLNGLDSLFALIEISIFTFDYSLYKKYLSDIDYNVINSTNGEILAYYLQTLGDCVFENAHFDLNQFLIEVQEKCSNIMKSKIVEGGGKTEKKDIIGYFYWDYQDTSKWVGKIKENGNSKTTENRFEEIAKSYSSEIILIARKADEAQTKLYNWTFTDNNAVETNTDENGSKTINDKTELN